MITRFNTDKRCYCAPIPRPIADRYCKCGCNNLFSPKRVDQVYLNKRHADFAYNKGKRKVKNEKMIEVQKILLKNDNILRKHFSVEKDAKFVVRYYDIIVADGFDFRYNIGSEESRKVVMYFTYNYQYQIFIEDKMKQIKIYKL